VETPQTFEANEKLNPFVLCDFLAADWSKWRRLLWGSTNMLETPQGAARGGSRSPHGKRSHLRKSTAVFK